MLQETISWPYLNALNAVLYLLKSAIRKRAVSFSPTAASASSPPASRSTTHNTPMICAPSVLIVIDQAERLSPN